MGMGDVVVGGNGGFDFVDEGPPRSGGINGGKHWISGQSGFLYCVVVVWVAGVDCLCLFGVSRAGISGFGVVVFVSVWFVIGLLVGGFRAIAFAMEVGIGAADFGFEYLYAVGGSQPCDIVWQSVIRWGGAHVSALGLGENAG